MKRLTTFFCLFLLLTNTIALFASNIDNAEKNEIILHRTSEHSDILRAPQVSPLTCFFDDAFSCVYLTCSFSTYASVVLTNMDTGESITINLLLFTLPVAECNIDSLWRELPY